MLFGYDFFISYSRKDGTDYAVNLAKIIIEKGYSCYLDQWGSDPGKKLPLKLKSKIKNSSVFIILASNEAISSKAIKEEINLFLPTNRTIIPVDFGSISEAKWFSAIEGIALFNEIDLKNPSIQLIDRLENSFIYTKQSRRIFKTAVAASFLIIISIVVIFFSAKKINELDIKSKNYFSISNEIDSLAMDKMKRLQSDNKDVIRFLNLKDNFLYKRDSFFSVKKEKYIITESHFIFTPIYFNYNESFINNEDFHVLDMILKFLNEYPQAFIYVKSSTYNFWWDENVLGFFRDPSNKKTVKNLKKVDYKYETVKNINRTRAENVKDYFKSKGIDEKRIVLGHEYVYITESEDMSEFESERYNRGRRIEFFIISNCSSF